jgi:acyl carrier protein phosphodiesterase
MNFLAHLYLAGDCPERLVGQMMADFVRGRVSEELGDGIRAAIQAHRRIDAFSDRHPVVLRSKRRSGEENRRYAGVAVDLFYDHFLARHWERFSPVALEAFTHAAYETLLAREAIFPERMALVVRRMAAQDWLGSYREVEGIGCALRGISRRCRRENRLPEGVRDLRAHYAAFEDDFLTFFPEVVRFSAEGSEVRA